MDFELILATEEHKEAIGHLMQFYIYDFSEYLDYDVEENGFYKPYPSLDDYWSATTRKFPYVIIKEGKFVGFVLVHMKKSDGGPFAIAEFFIMKKYRRTGIGSAVAKKIFALHPGAWEVHQREENVAAVKFWIKVIGEYTSGHFTQRYEEGRCLQYFRTAP